MNQLTPLLEEFDRAGRSETCPVIDMHGHYGHWYAFHFPHPEAEGMLRDMDRCGVRLAVCSHHAAFRDPARGNALLREAVQAHPDRFRGYWVVHPHYTETLEAELAALTEAEEFVGVKVHPGMNNYPLEGDRYRPVFEWAEATGRPVLSHTWTGGLCSAANVRAVAERHPRATLIMGHSIAGEFEAAIGLAREHPNLYLELTGVTRTHGLIEWMVREAGADKILFGEDLPWFDPHWGMGAVLWSRISDEDRHAILHGNAERLLKQAGCDLPPWP